MLENWLRPIALEKVPLDHLTASQFGKKILLHIDTLPDLTTVQLALIGMHEPEANAVRQSLYELSFPFNNLMIADLGNVRKPDNSFVIPLLKELLDSQILPILISPSQQHILALYKAFQSLQSHVSLAIVDERIRLDVTKDNKDAGYQMPDARRSAINKEANYLNDILLNSRARLFHFGCIGTQTHYTDPATFYFLDKNNFDCVRLGHARADLSEVEPIVRDGDLLTFHLAALKQSDAPAQESPTPSGFLIEEACQICRYAGMSDKLRAFGIFGFQAALDREAQTAQAVAQMIWYFVEGFTNRKQDFPVAADGLTEYIVEFKGIEYQLVFWKSQRSGRWWMQVPVKIGKKFNRHKLIPCSYNDYKLACQDELPERLLNAYKRFL